MRILVLMVLLVGMTLINSQTYAQEQNSLEKASGAVVTDKKTMWGKAPGESLLKPMLNKYVVNEMIDIRPIEGHHFNLKANNNCNLVKPQTLKPEFMQCQFEESGMYKINAYICDDKESFCKFEKLDVLVSAPRGYKKAMKKRVSSNILYVPKAELSAPPGFVKNRDQFAIAEAKKKNQPLLIVFSAQWCPACNMLDENVWQNKKFQDQAKGVVKLILDVDSDISWDLKEKFKIGGYPTTVLTTSTLNEIGRFVGYRTETAVSNWLGAQLAQKDNPIEMVVSKVEKGMALEKDVLRLAQWQLDRDEPANTKITLLKQTSPEAKKLSLIADYKIFENDNKPKEAAEVLAKLIDENPKDILASQWAMALSEKDPEALKKRIEKVKESVATWAAGTEIDSSEFTRAELYYNLGSAFENLEEGTSSRQNFASCAEDYKKISEKSPLKTPRGAQMERGFCLVKAGMNEEALKIFGDLVKIYRTEFAFNYYYAKALFDTGSVDKAYIYAKSALEGSYGDNMIRAAVLKAQIELEQKKLNIAESTLTKTLEKVYLPSTTQIRSHRYVANLKGLLAKIQIQKEALKTRGKESDDAKKTE
ncbi:MAG: thioredoxin family protein [Bdellovibrionota bacterium]